MKRPRAPWGQKSDAWNADYNRLAADLRCEPWAVERSARIKARGMRCSGDGPDVLEIAWELADRLEVARLLVRGLS